jgi:hypothetical protein
MQITPPPIDHDRWQQFRMDNFGNNLLTAVDSPCMAGLRIMRRLHTGSLPLQQG